MQRRVIKIGGSLLGFEGLQEALPPWLSLQAYAVNVLVIGGGAFVEEIRVLDRRFALGEEAAHWLSLCAMGVSARLAAALWPEFVFVSDWLALRQELESSRAPIIFDAEEFLRRHEPALPGAKLPHSWSATSDSIAARVAESLAADELVLLKSSLPEHSPISLTEAASMGYVDAFFPRAAEAVPRVRIVNLRSRGFDEAPLHPGVER